MTDPPNGASARRLASTIRNADGTVASHTVRAGGLGSAVIDQWTYGYDAIGRVTSKVRSGVASQSDSFTFDEVGRLSVFNGANVVYDPNGNRLSGVG